jgi:membrane-bound lytic murein transglycosylase
VADSRFIPNRSLNSSIRQRNTHDGYHKLCLWIAGRSSSRLPPLARGESEERCVLCPFTMRNVTHHRMRFVGLNFEDISKQLDKPEVWTAAVFYGQAKVNHGNASVSIVDAAKPVISLAEPRRPSQARPDFGYRGRSTPSQSRRELRGRARTNLGLAPQGEFQNMIRSYSSTDEANPAHRTPCFTVYTKSWLSTE